jgi:HPt (histidine-containing phosphotransfer) domain-containing protein
MGESFARFLDLFIHRTEELGAAIASAVAEQDGPTLAAATHALKGSAANLGADRLVMLVQRLEQRGRDEDFADIEPLLNEMLVNQQLVLEEVARLRALAQ